MVTEACTPTTPAPEHFVVRVYRRDTRRGRPIAGTVEIVGTGAQRSFASLRELEQILCSPPLQAGMPTHGETR